MLAKCRARSPSRLAVVAKVADCPHCYLWGFICRKKMCSHHNLANAIRGYSLGQPSIWILCSVFFTKQSARGKFTVDRCDGMWTN